MRWDLFWRSTTPFPQWSIVCFIVALIFAITDPEILWKISIYIAAAGAALGYCGYVSYLMNWWHNIEPIYPPYEKLPQIKAGLEKWVEENATGRCKVSFDRIYFENDEDAVLFKMTFC